MPDERRASGVTVSIPAGIAVEDAGAAAVPPPPGARRRRTTPASAAASPVDAALVSAFVGEDMQVLDAFSLTPTAPAPATRRRGPGSSDAPARIRVDVEGDEQAAILLEQDGVYAWHLPTG